MKLASIVNVWFDASELLPYCIKNLSDCGVDGIIIIWSEASNHREVVKDYLKLEDFWPGVFPIIFIVQREPFLHYPLHCETDKRNFGIEKARELGYTHFLNCDSDELYKPEEFKKAKERFKNEPDLKGLVCPSEVFFKSPCLTVGRDVTLVPFIHELTPTIKCEFNKSYPHAWIRNQIRIDPSRSFNINSGVEYTEDVTMFHYSYVRKNLEIKIRNSSARANLERSPIREDYANAAPGVFNKFYGKTLQSCENIFNLPEFGTDLIGSQNNG